MDKADWGDLKFLLEVARCGSALSAARALRVSHVTVLRRIQSLEKKIGAPLFDRLKTGYVPTPTGCMLVEVGIAFDRGLEKVQEHIDINRNEFTGNIRFAVNDSLSCSVMPEILEGFGDLFPNISVNMRCINGRFDAARNEADVVLLATLDPPTSMVGKRLATVGWGVYGAEKSWTATDPEDWRIADSVLPDGLLANLPAVEWFRSRTRADHIAAADSFVVLRQLAERGMGVTVLPTYLSHGSGLMLLEPLPKEFAMELWLLRPVNVRQVGRIRAFVEHVSHAFEAPRAVKYSAQA